MKLLPNYDYSCPKWETRVIILEHEGIEVARGRLLWGAKRKKGMSKGLSWLCSLTEASVSSPQEKQREGLQFLLRQELMLWLIVNGDEVDRRGNWKRVRRFIDGEYFQFELFVNGRRGSVFLRLGRRKSLATKISSPLGILNHHTS